MTVVSCVNVGTGYCGVNDGTCVNGIHMYFGCLPIDHLDARKVGFVYKLRTCNNKLLNLLYNIRGKYNPR